VSRYKYDNPKDAYKEALRRIERAQDTLATKIDLYRLGLVEIPPKIWQLRDLRELVLRDNQLMTIPSEIGQLTELRLLSLHKNKLKAVPLEIIRLTKLKKLYLS